jgi:hypothetical protein
VEQRKAGSRRSKPAQGTRRLPTSATPSASSSDADYVCGQRPGATATKKLPPTCPILRGRAERHAAHGRRGAHNQGADAAAQAYARHGRRPRPRGRDSTQNAQGRRRQDSIHAGCWRDPRLDRANTNAALTEVVQFRRTRQKISKGHSCASGGARLKRSPDLDMPTQLQGNPYAQHRNDRSERGGGAQIPTMSACGGDQGPGVITWGASWRAAGGGPLQRRLRDQPGLSLA